MQLRLTELEEQLPRLRHRRSTTVAPTIASMEANASTDTNGAPEQSAIAGQTQAVESLARCVGSRAAVCWGA